MKPRLPLDVQPGDLCDQKGVPILVGDLLRTFHFTGRRKKKYWLYHVVRCRNGALVMTPAEWLANEMTKNGGECRLQAVADTGGVLRESLILAGWPYPEDRKKRKVKP